MPARNPRNRGTSTTTNARADCGAWNYVPSRREEKLFPLRYGGRVPEAWASFQRR